MSCVRDNRGTEFLLTFLENFQRQGHQPALFISTQSPTATVTITLPSTGQTTTVTATNGQVTEVDLNRVAVELRGSRKSDKAIHVTSDEEIVIYGVFAEWATSDAYLALPTDVLGTEYFVACMTVRRAWSEEGWYNLPTEIGIVGVYDGTTITINPTQDLTFGGTNYPAGQDFTVSLDRFQTLQVQSTEDLTGSRITSSHPVSVLSGNLFTVIGNNQQGSGDHIVEMMPPVDTWGKEFVTAPIAKRTAGDIFRVVAARDNTEVTVTGRNPRNLNAGQFWEFEAGSNEYLHVTSNEPVLLVQYSKTAAADNTDTDPFSMIIPPVAQFEADYTFSTVELLYNGGAGTTHHVNLVIQSADKSGIIFDGQPLPGSTVWHPVPGTTYEATDLTISAGTHTATHSSPIATFGLFSYGLTNLEAYGYPGGLRLAQIGGACTPTQTVANDRVDNDCDGRVDEELRNGIDDDGDGLIDEDIASGGFCNEEEGYSWTEVDGEWGCHCVGSCCEREICYAWGDPHTCTPDGRVYHFQGPCRYTFAKDCLNGDFTVEVQQVPSHWRPTVSLVREVYVMAYGYTITIKQGRVVTVDPQPPPSPATLPFSLAGGNIVVRLSGRFVRVELTALCVVIFYDGSHHIKAEIPSNYKSNLCGLCGNYNGIASDDYLMPDGTLALNWNDFGNSWEVTSESCQGDRPTGEPPTQGPCDPVLSDQCNVLTDTNGPFAECHGFVDPGTYWGTCVFDICETEGAIFCENLETYYDACLAAGGTPFDWRTPTNCPMDCPANSAYSPCTTACPASCPDPNPTCTEACVEGCVCNDGFILSGLECVPLVDCGCIDENGFYHALGAQWGTPDGRRCECTVGGNIECEQVSCDEAAGYSWTLVDGVWGCNCVDSCCEKEICYAWGDPHTCTPDGRVYHFQGPCRYTFAKDCLNGDFTVEVQQVPSHWRPTVSLVREVYVMAYGYTITIKQGRVVTVDPPPPPSPATLPFSLAGGNIVVRLSGRFVRIELTALCVVIFYDGSHHIKAEIPSNYKSNLCGLCGNYNGIASDDYLMPDGTLALNWNDFGNSWEVTSESCQGDRPTGEPPTQGPCDPVFSDQCNVLTDTNGPFAECHGFVDPGTYWGTCVFDICETEGAIFCENLETYYDACLAAGGTPFDWRTPTNCPMDCPANSAYSPCTTACPASCADPNPTCTEACVEGCVCNDGFILSGLECVPLADCGCIDENGFYHALGAQWGTPDGRRCECTVGGNIECEQVSCDEAAGYSWTLVDGVWGCNCVDSCCEREICYAWGDPHTCTPDGRVYHFQGPCRYTFAKDCLNGDFNVEVQQVPSHWRPTVSLVREVYVMAYGYTITIKQGRVVTVDPPPPPSPATLPFSLAGGNIVVRLSGRFVRVELTALCVVIFYDGSHHIKAEIPSNYKSNLCGLCGNYNGIASDDYLMPDGTLALNWNDFGNSWEVTSESCQGDRPTGEPPTQGPCDPVFSDQCNVLTDTNGPFAECHGFVDPGTYWGTCVFDICETEGAIFCENLETYYDACLAAGGTPFDWRTPTNCPLDCPANSAYSPCATACPASCPDPNPTCTEACVEGCVCNDGFILSGLECVPLADCGCIDENGFYHALGDEWRDDGMKCTCTADGIVCEPLTRTGWCDTPGRGICTACGDPHFSTFDGLRHHFQGPCRYTFAKDCGESNDFTVEVQHVPVPSRPVVSVVREVFVLAYGYEVGIHQRRTVTVNGAPRTVSFSLAGGRIRVSLSGRRVHVQLVEFCVDIYYDGSHCVEVKVTPYYLDRMCGLCGNYNGNKGDDYMMSDLITIASNWNDFGFSWLVEDEDENSCEGGGKGPRPCPEGLMTLVSNTENCGLITDTSGPFAACHTAVPPADFFEDCTFDMCARGGDIVGLCENLEHYVLACEGQGVSITWRTPTLCPLSCPPNSHYNPCTSPCPPTCQDPNPVCAEVCVESCECDDGYIMSGLHCVLPEDCGCTDPVTGRYYELGETWIEDGERCVCKEDNTIECKECVFDIVFLLDRSSSIGPYGMFNAKKFITSIIECLKDLDVDVGYICFECITKWLVKQGLYDVNDPAIIQQIKDAEYTGGEGRTGHALQHLIQTAEYRKNVSSVAVVLSDGDVHDQGNTHEINSDAARAEGIELYSVPVGREALFNFGVLQYIAGAPDRVFDQFSTCDLAIKIMQDVCVIEEELASPDEYLP
ncbi:IgGFc-binding protein-like isoform X2 [Branchiostoma floridae x Branchiostoma belcheri]